MYLEKLYNLKEFLNKYPEKRKVYSDVKINFQIGLILDEIMAAEQEQRERALELEEREVEKYEFFESRQFYYDDETDFFNPFL